MAYQTSHILYEWTNENGFYRSLIIHRLDNPDKFRIPHNAIKTPVRYSYYLERWFLSNGKALELPYKVHLFSPIERSKTS